MTRTGRAGSTPAPSTINKEKNINFSLFFYFVLSKINNIMKTYKTFEDLKFKKYPCTFINDCKIAQMNFPNKYGISVMLGKQVYSNGKDTYEVAVLYEKHLCYTSSITDDVLEYQTKEEVTEIMKRIQDL